MEFKSGFDATPYMESASWADPQKSWSAGLKVHPNKKSKQRKGSEYLPVLPVGESMSVVLQLEVEGLLPIPRERDYGAPEHDYDNGQSYSDFRDLEREWHISSNGLAFARREAEIKAHNESVQEAETERRRRGIIPTDTAEFTYKLFRLLASPNLEHAKSEGLTPVQFYKKYASELTGLLSDAQEKSGYAGSMRQYIKTYAPKLHKGLFEQATPKTEASEAAEPETVEALQKKLTAAGKRRDKAQAEIDALDLQITALLSAQTVEEVRHDFYGDMEAIQREVEAKPEPLRKSKKQQQREERRARRRAKRSGRKTSERIAA